MPLKYQTQTTHSYKLLPRRSVRQLLEDQQKVHDLALSFVETELGANHFVKNWRQLKASGDHERVIQRWLTAIGSRIKAADIILVLDDLAAIGSKWLTPFTSPVPLKDRVIKIPPRK